MKKGFLSEYFDGVVAKRLSGVESNPDQSNQHEFNGVNPLKKLLGTERLTDCPSRFIWLGEENEGVSEDCSVTWYDSRESHPTRSEFRLYFKSNPVMELASTGDLLIVARRSSGEIMIIIVSAGSTVENQLLWLFGVPVQIGTGFEYSLHEVAEKIKTVANSKSDIIITEQFRVGDPRHSRSFRHPTCYTPLISGLQSLYEWATCQK